MLFIYYKFSYLWNRKFQFKKKTKKQKITHIKKQEKKKQKNTAWFYFPEAATTCPHCFQRQVTSTKKKSERTAWHSFIG